jgi:site-specific DNA recombinase
VINKTSEAPDGPTRLPADELEELVLSQVQSLLQSPQRMQDVLCDSGAGPEEIQRAAERAQKWAAAKPDQVRAILPSVLERVVIRDGLVELQLSNRVMREGITGLRESPSRRSDNGSREDRTIISVAAAFARCRGEVRLVLPPDIGRGSQQAIPSLVKAVARAHEWVDRIAKGEVPHQRAIATETGLHRRYVGRIMQLAFLAPDITESILEGRQLPHITLETLMDNMPVDWVAQRSRLLASILPTAYVSGQSRS